MNWKVSAAFAVFSFFGVGSLIYLLLHKDEENDDVSLYKASKATVVEIRIPTESVKSLIGKKGNIIKEIEMRSNTTIKVINDSTSADFKICVIRGTPEAALYAECCVHNIINYYPYTEIFEMYIPSTACGRLIGKRGKNIQMIQMNSNAALTLESFPTIPETFGKKLVIKGTSEQIAKARVLVEQKLEVERISKGETEIFDSNKHNHKKSGKEKQKDGLCDGMNDKTEESLCDKLNEEKVYLSAVESPDQFWLQKSGKCFTKLLKLIDEMTNYYSKEENKELHKLENLKLGQIVAVLKSDSGKWSRARILEIQVSSDSQKLEILSYNVDFGGTENFKMEDVYELKTDFLNLKFQAIECMLAKVKPRDSTWSKEAIDFLHSLNRFAESSCTYAKILGCKEKPAGTKKENSRIVLVELFYSENNELFNVAEALVEKGLAIWTDDEVRKRRENRNLDE